MDDQEEKIQCQGCDKTITQKEINTFDGYCEECYNIIHGDEPY